MILHPNKNEENFERTKTMIRRTIKTGKSIQIGDLLFVDTDLKSCFLEWIEYKKAKVQDFKSVKSIKACYEKLLTLSNSDPLTANQIVQNSMANNWSGLFELPAKNKLCVTAAEFVEEKELKLSNKRR